MQKSLLAQVVETYPELADDLTALASRIGEIEGTAPRFFADYYLAQRCARGDARALSCFEVRFLSRCEHHVAPLRLGVRIAEEVRGALRDRLLPPPAGVLGKIATFRGTSPLDYWVRIAAQRVALTLLRRDRPLGSEQPALWQPDPMRDALRARYQEMFKVGLAGALAALSPRERTLLRLYFIDGLSMESIAPVYRVDRATISRWLGKAKERLFDDSVKELRQALHLTNSELQSLIDVLLSQFDLDLQGLLTQS
jgi:RNA polymerase sigma-70 factor (ECF subfamily)